MERVIAGLVASLIVIQLAWVGTTVTESQVALARIQVLVASLTVDVNEAVADGKDTQARLRQVERDSDRIKQKLNIN